MTALTPTTLILKANNVLSDGSRAKLQRDKVIDPSGTLLVYDLGRYYSWPSQVAPVNGDSIKDGTYNASHAVFTKPAAGAPGFAGGGLDFANGTDGAAMFLKVPAAVLAPIWSAAHQYWACCYYAKLPASADWPASTKIFANFCSSGIVTTAADLFSLAMTVNGSLKRLTLYRSTGTGTYTQSNVDEPALSPFMGKIVQILVYRNATGVWLRLKTDTDVLLTQNANSSSVESTGDFSAKYGGFGLLENTPPTGAAKKLRLYRMWLENLAASGRDPLAVADADWTRVAARGVFS